MDFELSDLERELATQVAAMAAGRFPLSSSRAAESQRDVVDPDAWQALIDVGVFSLLVPEDEGGLGLGLAQGTVVMEELGRVLALGPIVSTMALSPNLAAAADGIPHGLIEEPPSRSAFPLLVEHPESIASLVVVGPIEDSAQPPRLIPVVDLELDEVAEPLDPLTPLAWCRGVLPEGAELEGVTSHQLRQRAMVLASAFQVGIATEVVALATEYAKGREQFGRAIGSFQAIKHLLADAICRAELARAAVHAAAVTLDDAHVASAEGDTMGLSAVEVRWRAAASAKLLADEAAITHARTAIQVHGGMGFTWEVPVHLYLKRARVLASSFGTRAELADMMASLI